MAKQVEQAHQRNMGEFVLGQEKWYFSGKKELA